MTNNVLDLTDGTGYGGGIGAGVARTAFYNTPVPVNASFNATFTYTPLYGTGNSNYDNGFAFILTSSSNIEQVAGSQRGFAIGPDANNGLEYDGAITPSVEIDYDVFQGSNAVGQPSGAGTGYNTNGGTNTSISVLNGNSYVPGDPIKMTVTYNAQTQVLSWSGMDVGNGMAFSESETGVNLQTLTGGGTSALIGFGGADGFYGSTQSISNFNFSTNTVGNNVLPVTTDLFIASGGTLDLFGGFQQADSLSGSGAVTNSISGEVALLTVSGVSRPPSPVRLATVLARPPWR